MVVSYPIYFMSQVFEYTPAGDFVQAIDLPGPAPDVRGVVTDGSRILHAWNRPFDALLSTYDPGLDAWVNHTFPGWSSVNCVPCNGIDAFDPYVFANDMATFGGEERGIIRFHTVDYSAQRFGTDQDYSDVTVGQDGLVYARRSDLVDPAPPTVVDSYNPITLIRLNTITLAARSATIAIDDAGSIFGSRSDSVNQYDSAGNLVASYPVAIEGEGELFDIDLSADARFILTTSNGWVLLTDRNFQRIGAFQVTNWLAYATSVEGNRPPSARSGGTYSGTAGLPVTFNGSASSDPDTDSLVFSWDFGDGTTGSGENPIHTYSGADSFPVVLTVSDAISEASDTTYVRVTYLTTMSAKVAPNPVRDSAVLTFHTARPGPLRVDMFDVTGRWMRTLMDEPQAGPGVHQTPVDGKDLEGKPIASGVYYYSIQALGQSAKGRFTILR